MTLPGYFVKVLHANNGDTMFNDNSPRANRLFRTSDGTLKMRDLYNILHDKLEYCQCNIKIPLRNGSIKGVEPLSKLTDIDALCQTFCYEVEKALGLHPPETEPALDMGPWTGGVTPVVSSPDHPFTAAHIEAAVKVQSKPQYICPNCAHAFEAGKPAFDAAEPKPYKISEADRQANARARFKEQLERVNSGRGYTAHYLAGVLLEAMKEGLI